MEIRGLSKQQCLAHKDTKGSDQNVISSPEVERGYVCCVYSGRRALQSCYQAEINCVAFLLLPCIESKFVRNT